MPNVSLETPTAMPAALRRGRDPIPQRMAIAVLALLLLLLVGVGTLRGTGGGPERDDPTVVATRVLRFEDVAGGAVAVIDQASGEAVATMSGEQGFLRGVLRSLMRERKRTGVDPRQPFELIRHEQGRLTLRDPFTGQHIALESFGPDNLAVFDRWVPPGAPPVRR